MDAQAQKVGAACGRDAWPAPPSRRRGPPLLRSVGGPGAQEAEAQKQKEATEKKEKELEAAQHDSKNYKLL